MTQEAIVLWTEIPVSDLPKSVEFYNRVFDWTMTISTMGTEQIAVLGNGFGAIAGNLVEGPSAHGVGPVIYIGVADVIAATDRAKLAGARVLTGPLEIPPGRYTSIEDPDGNRIGLFQPKAA